MEAGTYEFDGWTVDLDQRTLTRNGVRVSLQPRTYDLLAYLVTHAGVLLTKEALLGDVWAGVVVTDNSLTRSVRQLRVALQDIGEQHRYIETVPRAGYRFIASVRAVGPVGARASPGAGARRFTLVAAAVSLALLTLIWFVRPVPDALFSDDTTTIAVLPFLSLTGELQDELFSNGVSEEILNELARYKELNVIARTSSFAFRNSDYDVPRLADLLDADYLLQGSLRRDGTKLRHSVQLIDHAGRQVWSHIYDGELGEILQVQQAIASAVVESIAPHLTVDVRGRTDPDPEAYRHYVIGREIVASRLPNLIDLAPRHLSRALQIDPNYPEALAELGVALTLGAGWVPELHAQFDEAREAIARALELRPDLARAHAARGLLLSMLQPPDLIGSERALRRAIELDPNHVDALNWLAGILLERGHLRQRVDLLEVAARLDPLSPPVNSNLAASLAERGDFTRAEHHLRRLLEVPRPWVMPRQELAFIYMQQGRLLDASRQAKASALIMLEDQSGSSDGSVTQDFPVVCLELPGEIFARLGMWNDAHRWHDVVERTFKGTLAAPLLRSTVMRRQGRYSEMLNTYRRVMGDAGPSRLPRDSRLDYGTLLALNGDHGAALEVLKPEITAGESLSPPAAIRARHALAWAHLQRGGGSQAAEILRVQERHLQAMQDEGFLHLSDDLMLFAQNALLAGRLELAVRRLGLAVDAGWRDYYAIEASPWWQVATQDSRVRALLLRVKADIDHQRSTLEQRDEDELDRVLTQLSRQWARL